VFNIWKSRIKMDEKIKILMEIIIGLILIQGVRFTCMRIIFYFIERTLVVDTIISASLITVMTLMGIITAKKKGISLAVFPIKHSSIYAFATLIEAALLILTPFITGDKSLFAISSLLYSAVITPVFEELIFRGYIWNKLEERFDRRLIPYIITTLLFALWHVGYIDTVIFRMTFRLASDQVAFVMLMKVVTGLFFGIILGAVRYKSRNCYSTIILHGVMNIFGR